MAKLWDIPVNWRQSYQVDLEFRTSILRSRSGREQRRALRQTPRKATSFLSLAATDKVGVLTTWDVAARRITSGQGGDWEIGDFSLATVAPTGAPLGADRIAVESVPFWAIAGARVVLAAGKQIVAKTVLLIAGNDIVFDSLLAEAWPARTKVLPALAAHLATEIGVRTLSATAAELSVNFIVDPGTEIAETPPVASLIFNGREVFTKTPNWREPLSRNFVSGRESVDYGFGRTASFLPAKYPEMSQRAVYVGRDRADIDSLRHFFLRMKGQRGEFYMPSGTDDIRPKAALASADTYLTVAGTDFAAAFATDTVHKAIALLLADGTTLYRKVASVAVNGSDSRLTCTTNWGADIALGNIRKLSWMPVWRLASDALALEFLTDGVAQTTLPMKTLEDLAGT